MEQKSSKNNSTVFPSLQIDGRFFMKKQKYFCTHFPIVFIFLFFSISGHIVVAHNKINEWIKRKKITRKEELIVAVCSVFLSLFYLTISDKYNGKGKKVYYEALAVPSLDHFGLNVLLCSYPIHASLCSYYAFLLELKHNRKQS